MTKSGKKLFVIGLLIIVAAIVYFFIIKPNGSPFGFGSVTSNYAIPVTFKTGVSQPNDYIGQIPGQLGKLITGSATSSSPNVTPVAWASGATYAANAPSVSTSTVSSLISTTKFTSSAPNILWLFPTKTYSTGLDSSGAQMFDTFILPTAFNALSGTSLDTFNWYMNQDSINAYMSDIDLDIDYNNKQVTSSDTDADTLNPEKPGGSLTPTSWTGPYIKQTIGKALYGIPHNASKAASDAQTGVGGGAGTGTIPNGSSGTYNSNQISRTNNFVTVIANYTNLYSYICGSASSGSSSTPGYGLANIKVGTTSTAISLSYYSKNNIKIGTETTVGNWQGKPGAFNDCAFYDTGSSTSGQSNFVLDGNVKHAIWSVLLSRQNQLIGRLEPNIVKTL